MAHPNTQPGFFCPRIIFCRKFDDDTNPSQNRTSKSEQKKRAPRPPENIFQINSYQLLPAPVAAQRISARSLPHQAELPRTTLQLEAHTAANNFTIIIMPFFANGLVARAHQQPLVDIVAADPVDGKQCCVVRDIVLYLDAC